MCGGVFCNWTRIPDSELKKYYTKEEIEKMKREKGYQSFFWSKRPVLPVEVDGKVELKDWGNRSKEVNLPKTGWAKGESIDEGKWAYLNPKFVKIPADKGYEKGVWFEPASGGFKGVEVNRNGEDRVYVMTKPASKEYQELTKHDREPVEW